MQTAQSSPVQLSQTLGGFVPPDLRAKFDSERATTEKNLAEAAKARSEAAGGGATSEAKLDADAQRLLTKQNMGQSLTAEEAASLKAYQERKRTVSDPAAIEAANRQAATQAAQVASQRRQQDFEALKEARSAIQKDVNTPYITAKTSADTMRDVVTAAKGGNRLAGSLQSLETTMAAIRAQGLNRINATEVANAAGAGSMWDRIQGWLGKATEGQPVPEDIQKDMLSFADILERAAYKKYQAGHAATNKLYGTNIPEMLTAPTDQSGSEAGGGLPAVGGTFQGGKVLKVEKVQ